MHKCVICNMFVTQGASEDDNNGNKNVSFMVSYYFMLISITLLNATRLPNLLRLTICFGILRL